MIVSFISVIALIVFILTSNILVMAALFNKLVDLEHGIEQCHIDSINKDAESESYYGKT